MFELGLLAFAQAVPTFVDVPTFAGAPLNKNLESLSADFAVFGVPFNEGTWGWPGERYGLRAFREASQEYNHEQPVPMKITMSEDYGGLKRHEWEFVNNMAYSFGIFTADHSEELGFLYINPSRKVGYDASIRFEVTTAGEKAGVDPVLENAVREWVKSAWPFKHPAYPGRDIPLDKWNALPNAE